MGVRVRQKTKGKGNPWWVFITHNGKRTSRKVGDKKAAEAVASTIRAKLQLGEFGFEDKKPVPTFKEYATIWITVDVPALCKESTAEIYSWMLQNHVLPGFGDCKVTDITRGNVKDFLLGKINEGYSKSIIDQLKNMVSCVLSKAMDDETIQSNPALQLGKNFLKGINGAKKDIKALTSEELKDLLNTVEKHFPGHYPLVLLLARTGLRIGEALALQWSDFDFNQRFIEVRRGVYKGRITRPKNGKIRLVDMSPQLAYTLKAHKLACKKKGLALGFGDLPEYVFTNKHGKIYDTGDWRYRIFEKAVRKAGIRKIGIHGLRHTYATLRISKGDNAADVSKQLGHHSVKFTMDTYYEWFPGKKKSEVAGLDDPTFTLPDAPYVHPQSVKVT